MKKKTMLNYHFLNEQRLYIHNPEFKEVLDSNVLASIGSAIITILTVKTDVLKQEVIKEGIKNRSVLKLSEVGFKNKEQRLLSLPTKLPMVVKPKADSENVAGGYLLNDEKFNESLFIEKKSLWYMFPII